VGRFREVLDCGSPQPLFHRSPGVPKRQSNGVRKQVEILDF
jgi:hypothetical protein